MTKDTYLLEAFKSLGEIINHKDMEINLLKYENEKLKELIEKGKQNEE